LARRLGGSEMSFAPDRLPTCRRAEAAQRVLGRVGGVVISGGNVDPAQLTRVLAAG
jgi:hypothetical protein